MKVDSSFVQFWRQSNRRLLQWLSRLSPSEEGRILGLTVATGGICGLVAVSFHLAIHLIESLFINRALHAQGWNWIVATVLTPALGALVAGLFLQYVVPAARGSGIPQVKVVYTLGQSRLRFRDALGKFMLGALQLGTGASLGREGPTVHICSSVAMGLGRITALSPTNQRRLIPVGAAAGIAAAFNAPIAAVTFVIEELVGGLDTTVLSGVVVAAALAAVVEHSVLGEHPVFSVPSTYGLTSASSLVVYALLGVAAALVGQLFSKLLLGLRAGFGRLSWVPPWARPACGGAVTGALAVLAIVWAGYGGVTGGGYESLGLALQGNLPLRALVLLCIAKLLATCFSYASGGSGGIFAPVLFIGGMLGGALGHLDQWVFSHNEVQVGAFALVGMGALFAAVIRAPMTSVLIIFEMTGSYKLVLPLMISNSVAFLLARKLHPVPIYEALLEQDGIRLPHQIENKPLLAALSVSEAMTSNPVVLPQNCSLAQALERVSSLPFAAYPVVDEKGWFVGFVSEARLRRLAAEKGPEAILGEYAPQRDFLRIDQSLHKALSAMHALQVRQMAVVQAKEQPRVAGILTMSDITRAVLRAEASPSQSTVPLK